MSESDQSAMVVLRRCGDNGEADLWRGLLESNGVRCVIRGETHRSMLGVVGSYIELDLMVPRGQLEQAEAILSSQTQPLAVDEPDQAANEAGGLCPLHEQAATGTCSRCGAFVCAACGPLGVPAICSLCELRTEDDDGRQRRSRRRRVVALVMLAIFLGVPALIPPLLMLLRSLFR